MEGSCRLPYAAENPSLLRLIETVESRLRYSKFSCPLCRFLAAACGPASEHLRKLRHTGKECALICTKMQVRPSASSRAMVSLAHAGAAPTTPMTTVNPKRASRQAARQAPEPVLAQSLLPQWSAGRKTVRQRARASAGNEERRGGAINKRSGINDI